MEKLKMAATVVRAGNRPEVWLVEAVDMKDGGVYAAQFYGPDARERAVEYADCKFAGRHVES